MITVLGVKRSSGDYNGVAYDNYVFYFADTDTAGALAGTCPLLKGRTITQYKVKVSEYSLPDSPAIYVGRSVQLFYDQYGNVSDMRVI